MTKRVLIVDNEGVRLNRSIEYGDQAELKARNIQNLRRSLENIGADEIFVVYHADVSPEVIANLNPSHVILSGRFSAWEAETLAQEYKEELELIHSTTIPTLGICAGFQLMAFAYGAAVDAMKSDGGLRREEGFQTCTVAAKIPLFRDMRARWNVREEHGDEVKNVPKEFNLAASSSLCKVQVISHKDKPMVGVQFHPELYTAENPAGRQILDNFLNQYHTI